MQVEKSKTTIMEIDFEFKDVPAGYQVCFSVQCPMREKCLRWKAAQKVPSDKKWGPAIYPTALETDGSCPFYHLAEPIRMAYGFSKLFYNVLGRQLQGLRSELISYLGGKTNYYRCNRGERYLSPEQQTWILDCFRRAGYSQNLEFDGYVTLYDFNQR